MKLNEALAYTLFLVLFDALSSVVINLIQGNPGEFLMVSFAVRIIILSIIFPPSIFLVTILRVKGNIKIAAIASVITCLLIPITIFLFKGSQTHLTDTISDLYIRKEILIFVFGPFIVASIVNLILFNKYFNW